MENKKRLTAKSQTMRWPLEGQFFFMVKKRLDLQIDRSML